MTSSTANPSRHGFPSGNVDHHVLDLSHYQRVSPANPAYRDFIVATVQEVGNPNKTSFLRLERSRQGSPYSIQNLPELYPNHPLALCLLRDFLAQNLPRVHDDAKTVFKGVILALRTKDDDVSEDAACDPSICTHSLDLKARLGKLSNIPEDEGADTVTTIKGHPTPEEATLIQVAHRSKDYPLSIVFLACSASAAHLFDPIYRVFRQQSFWFVKVLMGVFLADGYVSVVQNSLPVRLVEDEVDYGEDGAPKLVKCIVENLLLETIHETKFCRDQMFSGFVIEGRSIQAEKEHARRLRKALKDSEAWIHEYRLKLEVMLKVFAPLTVPHSSIL